MNLLGHKKILYILVILSIWIIASVELKVIPLIPTSLSIDFSERLNRTLLSLANSFLAAYIFYILTTVLPRKALIYRSKKISAQQVHTLLYEIFVMINQILYIFNINKDILDIYEKDLLPINENTTKTYKGYYGTTEYCNTWYKKGKQITGFEYIEFEYPNNIYTILSKIPTLIQQIRTSNPNFHVDEEFAEILSSIETNKTIELYANKKNRLFLYSDTSKYLYKLVLDYKRLLKKGYSKEFRNSFHKIHIYTPEENAMVPIHRRESRSSANSLLKQIISLSPYIIYNNQSITANSIVAEMNSGYILDRKGKYIGKVYTLLSTQNEIYINDNCKCIIIIDIQLSKQTISSIISTNIDKIIILIRPSSCHTTKRGYFKNKQINNGIYKIYYRSKISFLGFKFNTQYPTISIIHTICYNAENIMRNYTKS